MNGKLRTAQNLKRTKDCRLKKPRRISIIENTRQNEQQYQTITSNINNIHVYL